MVQLFSKEEKDSAYKQKHILLALYLIFTFVFVAGNVSVTVCFILRLLGKGWGTFLNILFTGVWGVATLFFFGLKFPPVNKYCRMLKNMEKGLKDESTLKFIRFEEDIVTKDGVEFYSMIMTVKANKLGIVEGERNVLVEIDKEKPDLFLGDTVKIRTHANILMEYEIMKRASTEALVQQPTPLAPVNVSEITNGESL